MASFDNSEPDELVTVPAGQPAIKAEPTPTKRSGTGEPVPSVAVYTPPVPGKAHPKVARKSVALAVDEAEQNLNACRIELQSATVALRAAQTVEADAIGAFVRANPPPTAAEIHRGMIAAETARKLARIADGKSAVEPKAVTARSPVDQAAANRARPVPYTAMPPLRSNVVRRVV